MTREFIQCVETIQTAAAVVKYDHLLSVMSQAMITSVVSTIFNAELICTVIGSTSCAV